MAIELMPVTIKLADVRAELGFDRRQCLSVYDSIRGNTITVIHCRRPAGHTGDHRGTGKQWRDVAVEGGTDRGNQEG